MSQQETINLGKEEIKLIEKVKSSIINNLYIQGIISDKDLEDKTVVNEKISQYYRKNNIELQIIIDHRDIILNAAEREFSAGNIDFSITLFAIFIEHTLNKLIHVSCEHKKIDSKTSREIIKSVSIAGKCTWLLKLIGLPALKNEYFKTIIKIAEERNAYIHYKWKPEIETDDSLNKEDKGKKNEEKYIEIKKLIKYLKNYETRHEYAGKKSKIGNVSMK